MRKVGEVEKKKKQNSVIIPNNPQDNRIVLSEIFGRGSLGKVSQIGK